MDCYCEIETIPVGSMAHMCNRDTCPTANIAGPKATCIKCKKVCYLLCYGAEKSSTGMVRFKLPNSLTIYVDVMNAQFACNACVSEGNVVVQTTMQLTQKVAMKETGVNEVTNDKLMEALQKGFVDLKEHINANAEENGRDVKNYMDELTKPVNKTSMLIETPSRSSNKQLYSSVLKSKRKVLFKGGESVNSTPISSKRKRHDDSESGMNLNVNKMTKPISLIPKPMMGRSEAVIGQKPRPHEPKPPKKRTNSNGFEKSLRVAGLDPSVTVDELNDYIMKSTPLTDKTKFECTMLVKKGQDLSEFTYISAKIDVSVQDFDRLTNLDYWPNYVTVREFVRMDKRKQRNDESKPYKFQRMNNIENVPTTSTNPTDQLNSNMEQTELGFQK